MRVGVRVEVGKLEALEVPSLLRREFTIVRTDGGEGEGFGVLGVKQPHEQQMQCCGERGCTQVSTARVDGAEVMLDGAKRCEPLRVATLKHEALIATAVDRGVREEIRPSGRGE